MIHKWRVDIEDFEMHRYPLQTFLHTRIIEAPTAADALTIAEVWIKRNAQESTPNNLRWLKVKDMAYHGTTTK